MTDTRVRVPLNGKLVDLAALDAELGGHGLCGSPSEIVAVDGSPVTADKLKAAIAAHVPPALPVPTPAEKLAAAGLTLDDLKALGVQVR